MAIRIKFHLLYCLAFVLFTQLLTFCMVNANTNTIRTFNWVVEETSYTRLCSTKKILTVNGQFPGPTLIVQKGETIRVNVLNNGGYNVTMHWHGVRQPRNPWSDGPEYVTQCPIQPGVNFTYEVVFSTEEGTLWWHAHSEWCRATLHGPIIVRPKRGTTYPFPEPDAEFPIMLGSWWKDDVREVVNTAYENGGVPRYSDAYTINGQPGDFYDCSNTGTTKFRVDHGKTYLLRLINAAMNDEMFFTIANHTLTIVGIDGAYLKPFDTGYAFIVPGQSIDILVKADQTPSHYYIASRAYLETNKFDNKTTTAIFEYSENYSPPSSPSLPHIPDYLDTFAVTNFTAKLRSLNTATYPTDVPKDVHKKLFIVITVNTNPCVNNTCGGPHGLRVSSSLNNMSLVLPSTDILLAYYKRINGVYTTDFPSEPLNEYNYTADDLVNKYISSDRGTKVKVLKFNESVEIVFQGTNIVGAQNHPMHLHGCSFYVVGSGFGNYDAKTDPKNYNLVDPPLMNTAGVPKDGWAAIRFRADNPGVWLVHCHLERHASWGMGTVFIVRNGKRSANRIRRPPSYLNPC